MGFYEEMANVAAEVIGEFRQGVVTLTKTTTAPPDPATSWIPGAETTETYLLDATAKGVSQEFVNGTTILATDLEVTISPKAVHTLTDGVAADGATVDVDLDAFNVLTMDGKAIQVLQVTRIPPAGVLVAWKAIVRA